MVVEDTPTTICPAGYSAIDQNLDGTGKVWSQPHPDASRTIEDCAAICNDRSGCTGFEFAAGPSEHGACGTYTGGSSNIRGDEGRTSVGSNWRSCMVVFPSPPPPADNVQITSSADFTKYRQIALYGHHSTYLVAESDGSANSNRADLGPWEKFTVSQDSDGNFCLLGYHNGYLVAENDGSLNSNRAACSTWERWAVSSGVRSGEFCFRNPTHNKYLCAESDGAANANRDACSTWETFKVIGFN